MLGFVLFMAVVREWATASRHGSWGVDIGTPTKISVYLCCRVMRSNI